MADKQMAFGMGSERLFQANRMGGGVWGRSSTGLKPVSLVKVKLVQNAFKQHVRNTEA